MGLDLTVQVSDDTVREERVRLEPGEVREVVYRVLAGATLRGVVLDSDGAPCPLLNLRLARGVHSGVMHEWEKAADTACTGDDGTFEYQGVRPGDWILGPAPRPDVLAWGTHVEVPAGRPAIEVRSRTASVTAGATTDVTFD